MPEVQINIGGRSFSVACQAGEEPFLQAAAGLLDAEASSLVSQIGRLPEARMLLMAGLMLADKTVGLEERVRVAEDELARLRSAPGPEPKRMEVPVIPDSVTETMAELAARAEALADTVDPPGAGG